MYHVTKFRFIYLSFKPGFHMIATIAEKKKFSDRSDHMETGLYCSLLLSCPFPSKPGYKFGFRSSVQKNGLPGEGRHEGLVPRNDVLTAGFIRFSLPRTLARIFFVPRLRPIPCSAVSFRVPCHFSSPIWGVCSQGLFALGACHESAISFVYFSLVR